MDPKRALIISFKRGYTDMPSFMFGTTRKAILAYLPTRLLGSNGNTGVHKVSNPRKDYRHRGLHVPRANVHLSCAFTDKSGCITCCPRYAFFNCHCISVASAKGITVGSLGSVPIASVTGRLRANAVAANGSLIGGLVSGAC